jgi:sigma-E factor negative regulatory protein RseC
MIREKGIVISRAQGEATVTIPGSSRCGRCGACSRAADGRTVTARVRDPIGVAPGDRVEVGCERIHPVRDSFLMFILPVLLFVAGYILGEELIGPAAAGAGLGIGLAVVPYLFLRVQERRGVYRMQVIRVLGRRPQEAPAEAITIRHQSYHYPPYNEGA